MRPIGIDLFAGAGGLSLGFEQAGFDVAAAVEIDPVHCAAHAYNFPSNRVIPRSVAELSALEIRSAAGIGHSEIDCVFGGAPCQGFSMIGQRALDDPRNKLVLEFVRVVRDLEARTFVFENVKGLTQGKHRGFLDELVAAFDAAGYVVRAPWRVLNAADYGTPQSRDRLILLGARKGESVPEYPQASTNMAGKPPKFQDLPFGPSCHDALGDLPDVDLFPELNSRDFVRFTEYGVYSNYVKELRCEADNAWHNGYKRIWKHSQLTSSARTAHTDISRRRFAETSPGGVEPISRFFKLPPDGVANTLRAGTDSARGAFTSPRPIHYKYPRCVTVREMARLHGFPDWFRFNATKWHGARQIGNAVPPPLARAVAAMVCRALGVNPSTPESVVDLGEESLLQMTVSEAANYFGVEAPVARRDRKSGAKKRKQIEIERERLEEGVACG